MASCHTHAAHQTIFPQKFLAEKSLPQIAWMCTEVSGARYSPTDFTDVHRLGEPTKLSSHRNHRTHRNDWRKIFSHGFHGYTQIRRVWHPCHTHAATKLSSHRSFWQRRASHRIHRIHRIFWRKIFSHGFHGCTQIRRVWHPAIPTQPLNYLPTEATEPYAA